MICRVSLLEHRGYLHGFLAINGKVRGKISSVVWGRAYHKICNIRRTKSPNLNVSRLVLQLFLPNSMKPGVKSRMKM